MISSVLKSTPIHLKQCKGQPLDKHSRDMASVSNCGPRCIASLILYVHHSTPSPPHVVIGFKLKKCPHSYEITAIYNFLWHWTVGNLFRDSHNFEANNGGLTLTLLAVKEMDINYVFTCNDNEVEIEV